MVTKQTALNFRQTAKASRAGVTTSKPGRAGRRPLRPVDRIHPLTGLPRCVFRRHRFLIDPGAVRDLSLTFHPPHFI